MLKSLVGFSIFVIGISMVFIAYRKDLIRMRDDLSWQLQPISRKMENELKAAITQAAAKSLSKYAISDVVIENHSATLKFLLNNKPVVFPKNPKGDHVLEIDILDLGAEDDFKGVILQMSLKNSKTNNKEEEILENVVFKDIHRTRYQLPDFVQRIAIKQ